LIFAMAKTTRKSGRRRPAPVPRLNGYDPVQAAALIRAAGLRYVATDELTIERRRIGGGFSYVDGKGKPIPPGPVRQRLKSLAVPPAYQQVFYAADPRAHIQAIGRDVAGRLQYRYHPDWVRVRETIKAEHLVKLTTSLPRIRRRLGRHLAGDEPTREFALAAVIELVGCSAIRAGGEAYARARGTRGAATLRKSHVRVEGDVITLTFPAKSNKTVTRQVRSKRLARAFDVLRGLPGRRLFQYRDPRGAVQRVRRRQVNGFLQEIAGVEISLKDFRTLIACAAVMHALAHTEPARSERRRRKQVLDAVRSAAEELANTPAICRKSYVHETVVSAFEQGALQRFSEQLKRSRSPAQREKVLASIIAGAAQVPGGAG
jgi:DNA topoisomerase-1